MALPNESITQVADGSQITRHLWNTPNGELLENDKYLDGAKLDKTGGALTGPLELPDAYPPTDNSAVTRKWVEQRILASASQSTSKITLYATAALVDATIKPYPSSGDSYIASFSASQSACLFTLTSHGLNEGDAILLFSTPVDCWPLETEGVFFIRNPSENTFNLSTTIDGPLIILHASGTISYFKTIPGTYYYTFLTVDGLPDDPIVDATALNIGEHIVLSECKTNYQPRIDGLFCVTRFIEEYPNSSYNSFVFTRAEETLNANTEYKVSVLKGHKYTGSTLTISAISLGQRYYTFVISPTKLPFDTVLEPVRCFVPWTIYRSEVGVYYHNTPIPTLADNPVEGLILQPGDKVLARSVQRTYPDSIYEMKQMYVSGVDASSSLITFHVVAPIALEVGEKARLDILSGSTHGGQTWIAEKTTMGDITYQYYKQTSQL